MAREGGAAMSLITYVGAGTAAAGVNASLNPDAHVNVAVGDLVLIFASIRNSGVGTVNLPAGWSLVSGTANAVVIARIWETGDAMPTITFNGGVANADTMARSFAFRGTEPRLNAAIGASTSQLNGSAQDIAYPALSVPGANHAVLIFAWKQDDSSGVSTPAGFTAIAHNSVTTGDDATQAVRYQIQTTDTDISSGTLTVTGGAAAISRSFVIAIRPSAEIAIQTQDSWPPRVLVTVSGLTHGHDEVEVVRRVGGVETTLRGGVSDSPIQDSVFLVTDAELPFGVPVTYTAIVNGAVRYDSATTTYTLTGGKVALTDATTGLAVETVIIAWETKQRDRKSTTYRVGARNIVVSGDLGQFEADVRFYLEADAANEQMKDLLEQCSSGVIQIRQPGGYAGVDCYAAVTSAVETRFSQDGSDERRTWLLHLVEVDGWAPTLEAQGFTLQDIYDFYGSSGTLQDLSDDHATLLDIAQAEWS